MNKKATIYRENVEVVELHKPFEIISASRLRRRHQEKYVDITDWHRIDFNALIIVTEGEGKHHIDCEENNFKAGAIIPLVKGQIHHFDTDNPITATVVTFSDDFILKNISETNTLLFLKMFHLPQMQINLEYISLLQPVFDLLFMEQGIQNTVLKDDIIRGMLIVLFLYIERLSPLEFVKSDTYRFKDFIRFKDLVAQKFNDMHNAKDYAKELNLSYKYLNDICKEMSGKTAKVFIDSWLVTEIKRDISQGVFSMKEITYRTGFDEPTNFIRFFKKHTEMTPKEFSVQLKNG